MSKKKDKPTEDAPVTDEGAEGFVNDEADGGPDDAAGAKITRAKRKADDAPEEKPPPPFGTAKPAGPGALPRVVPELARAGKGETRYKIACRNYSPQKTRYVLADEGDEAGAVACYLRANGLDVVLAKLRGRAQKPDDVEAPDLVVTELAD